MRDTYVFALREDLCFEGKKSTSTNLLSLKIWDENREQQHLLHPKCLPSVELQCIPRADTVSFFNVCIYVVVTSESLQTIICSSGPLPAVHQHRVVSPAVVAALAGGTAVQVDPNRPPGG